MRKTHNYSPMKDRFLEKVDKNGPLIVRSLGRCWAWTGSQARGYGRIRTGNKVIRVHRYSYLINVGTIPDDSIVCHKCDNKSCVRPSHLFVGDHQVNQKDKVNKNRQAKGETNGRAKLSEKDVIKIRRIYRPWSKTSGQMAIAAMYGVCKNTVRGIVKKESWRHL